MKIPLSENLVNMARQGISSAKEKKKKNRIRN